MGSSLIVISLALATLLTGIAIAAYQLWSANRAQKEGEHSALAHRFAGRPTDSPLAEGTSKEPVTAEPRI